MLPVSVVQSNKLFTIQHDYNAASSRHAAATYFNNYSVGVHESIPIIALLVADMAIGMWVVKIGRAHV